MTPDQRNFQMDRRRAHDEQLVLSIAEAVADAVAEKVSRADPPHQCLDSQEQQWVRLAIIKQEQSIKLRQAIIEKTLSGLAWSALVGLGLLLVDFAKNHGFK